MKNLKKDLTVFLMVQLVIGFMGFTSQALSLELEPRQWSHLPMDSNFGGAAYVYSEADIAIDPVLNLENVEMELETWGVKYIRTFEWFGQSARIDVTQAYQKADWTGLLDGVPGEAHREGASDSFIRFAVNLYGSPPLKGKAFGAYKAGKSGNTVIGVGMVTRLPTGDYHKDKLLNLGANRYALRPQLGISHQRGKWTTELTTEVAFYTSNDDFFKGNKLEQEPLYIVHGHLIYSFRPGLWLGASLGYDYGGEIEVNGIKKDNKKRNTGWGLSAAYPINRYMGVKFAYVSTRTKESTGLDLDNLVASLSYMW